MTMAIRSPPRTSTKGRAPLLSATIRFWMSVDSLKRPPTLLTMASSFRSSNMLPPGKVTLQDGAQLGDGGVQVVIDDLVLVLPRPVELPDHGVQPPADGGVVFGAPVPQPPLVGVQRRGPQEHGDAVGALLPDLGCPLDVDVEEHADAPLAVVIHLPPQRAVI